MADEQSAARTRMQMRHAEPIDADELWEMLCGEGSLLGVFARTQSLCELVRDIAIETVESDQFDALATLDPDDGVTPLIRMSTACYDQVRQRLDNVFASVAVGQRPWVELGWHREAFAGADTFAVHVARGHVERYLSL